MNQRWLFDKVYHDFIAKKAFDFGYETSFKSFDKGLLEIVGPTGIIRTFVNLLAEIRSFQSGFVYHYALLMLIGLTLFISIVGVWSQIDFFFDQRIYFVILSSIALVNILS